MPKKEKIIAALEKYTGALGPFISIVEFEDQRKQWYAEIDFEDVNLLLDLLVEGPSLSRFASQNIEEIGTVATEAISEFAKRSKVDILPKILLRLDEFTNYLHIIELLGMLGDSDVIPTLLSLYHEKKLSDVEKNSLFWSIRQAGGSQAIGVLGKIKKDLSNDFELQKQIDLVLRDFGK